MNYRCPLQNIMGRYELINAEIYVPEPRDRVIYGEEETRTYNIRRPDGIVETRVYSELPDEIKKFITPDNKDI